MTIFETTLFGIRIAPSYYGLMYALSFIAGYYIIKKRGFLTIAKLDDLLIYIVAGVILGGRLGYVMFYNFNSYINNPLDILKVWEGGMSFHGGVLGVILAMWIFSKRNKTDFLKLTDEITAILPIGLGLGRIGNYLNSELLGFSGYSGPLAVNGRFPSPLLESFLEGIVLYLILNKVYKNKAFDGQVATLFLIWYGIFRIFVEMFFREPDVQIGYIAGYFTLGEILSLPMVIVGAYLYIKFSKNAAKK